MFGLIGSLTAHRGMVVFFRIVYWTMTVASLILSVIFLIVFVVKRHLLYNYCIEETSNDPYFENENIPQLCQRSINTSLIVYGILVGVVNSLEFYFATVISAYAYRLKQRDQHEQLRTMEQEYPLAKTPY
ncbi:hypothetical protein EC973_001756 [Apophysomyces ossiformis]|uniref:Uncharacterized protein n=1 Tax=Apophysomyces ossiformis TaxID=679940 RepID=A0A8H7BLJ7_9FUNG|nr:hypothetical protein EC973_001756 [Apophysomyces ossiformis]